MKILIDMNLTPLWVEYLRARQVAAQHWSSIGAPNAPDAEIMSYAREHGFIVFTHDLDFGNILAVTNARGPSVLQVRTQDPVPDSVGELVDAALREHGEHLRRGALVTVDAARLRVRVLPMLMRRSTEE